MPISILGWVLRPHARKPVCSFEQCKCVSMSEGLKAKDLDRRCEAIFP